jgi:two-component system, NtrC family, C4-dicarboxylate transport response regulator DctD
MRRSTEQALELAGLSVQSFASAEEALDACRAGVQRGGDLSDIRMPGMDGMSLLQRLR